MARTRIANRQVVRLSFEDGEVVVTPKDKSVFIINAEKAVEACRETVRREERVGLFESELLLPLHDWCIAHADAVEACYIPLPRGAIQIFMITSSAAFDFALAEEIAALELRLARNGWTVSIQQLPNSDENSLATFFKPEGALEVYAQRRSTPEESGTKP